MNHKDGLGGHALCILEWMRVEETEWDNGYTRGYLAALSNLTDRLDGWEKQYIENIYRAHLRGIPA